MSFGGLVTLSGLGLGLGLRSALFVLCAFVLRVLRSAFCARRALYVLRAKLSLWRHITNSTLFSIFLNFHVTDRRGSAEEMDRSDAARPCIHLHRRLD